MQQDTPEYAPLVMPDQRLGAHFRDPTAPPEPRRALAMRLRCASVILAATALTAGAVSEMIAVLNDEGLTVLETVMAALFGFSFFWLTLALVNSTIGAVSIAFRRARPALPPSPPLKAALLIPVYNEAPERVLANALAMMAALRANRSRHHFDLFILSDTTKPEIAAAERAAIERARAKMPEGAALYYRRREDNVDKKAGNIRDWCRRYGAAYEAMLVLDADSLMSAHSIIALADALSADPGAGLVQSAPRLINTPTLFGRMQRFASAAYGPVLAEGLAWWAGDDGNYWGHNAIIRTRAFATCAGLPHLKGRRPFGGAILSHDFVEAALLRRAGWRVRVLPQVRDSFEEAPPTLVDAIRRDRRWSQGNLQHLGLIGAKGFRWVSRFHLLQGVMAYVTAPLWFIFLGVGIAVHKENVAEELTLTTNWFKYDPFLPTIDPERALPLLGLTLFVLIAPKLIGLASLLAGPGGARRWGGPFAVFGSFVAELLLSSLMAPIMMIHQSRAVLEAMLGLDAGWNAQRRSAEGGAQWVALLRFHAVETAIGVVAVGLVWSGWLSIWLAPIAASMALAAPISALLSVRTEAFVAATGVLSTPEDVRRPSILGRVARLYPLLAPPAAGRA